MKLLSGPLSMFGAKAQIAVAEKGIACEIEMVPFSIKDRYSPTHPDVARVNPKKQIPVLLDGAVEIFDSTQIFEYLEDRFPAPALWPASAEARAFARLMELKSDEVFFPSFIVLLQTLGDLAEAGDAIGAGENCGLLRGNGRLAGGSRLHRRRLQLCGHRFHVRQLLHFVHGWHTGSGIAAPCGMAPTHDGACSRGAGHSCACELSDRKPAEGSCLVRGQARIRGIRTFDEGNSAFERGGRALMSAN